MSKNFYLSNLKRLREQKGWTQEKLAQQSGVSYHTLIKIERGTIQDPRIETVANIARALGLSLDELVNF
ncbi:MAG: helix-turn-helix transcriptional regulator [Candidatus Pacebacteria bacterium]|nr:helix-turn-helix transcriptional regulator [Candidatus Paceibacterota bacterium]